MEARCRSLSEVAESHHAGRADRRLQGGGEDFERYGQLGAAARGAERNPDGVGLRLLDAEGFRRDYGEPAPLNVRGKLRAAPDARQRKPDVVTARVSGKRQLAEHLRRQFLTRRRFASYRSNDGIGAA